MTTVDQAKALRAPFPPEAVGKLPRVWCKACRDDRYKKVCANHTKSKCRVCGNNITDAHLHLDYVGHADITDRLLQVDADWTWEPVAFGPDGLPVLDAHGGLWLKLTVAGTTRMGYGHADGKEGPDAIKEAIGDGLRNVAMRFGVGLDLWGAHGADSGNRAEDTATAQRRTPAQEQVAQLTPAQRAKVAVDFLLRAATPVAVQKTQGTLGDVRDVEVPIVRGLGASVIEALALEGESITVGQLAHRVVAYVTKHGMSVREGADAA
jgi:hypothetical protein